MAATWIELAIGPLEQKKQYKRHKARAEALSEPFRSVAKAAADCTPVRAIVGDDPVEFAERGEQK